MRKHLAKNVYPNAKVYLCEDDDWISVDDGFPESGTRILAYNKEMGENAVRMAFYSVGNFYDAFECGCGIKLSTVTHWKPLPEPPKEKK